MFPHRTGNNPYKHHVGILSAKPAAASPNGVAPLLYVNNGVLTGVIKLVPDIICWIAETLLGFHSKTPKLLPKCRNSHIHKGTSMGIIK
jgi:hypothetical protein